MILAGFLAELWFGGFITIYHRAVFRAHLHEGWPALMNVTSER